MTTLDDYLKVAPQQGGPSLDAYLAGPAAGAPVAAPSSALAAAAQPAAPQGSQPAPLGSFLTGVGDAAKGTAQDITHGLSWLADLVAPDSQFAKDARAALPQMQQTIDQQNAAYEQARAAQQPQNLSGLITGQKPDLGIDWGRLAGNAVGTAPTMMIGPEYAGLSLPGKIAVGAAQGAAGAGMMPTTGDPNQSYASQKLMQLGTGAAFGGGIPAVAAGARAGVGAARDVLQPVFQPARTVGQGIATKLSPQDAATVAQNIRSAPQYVQGSSTTLAQAGAHPALVATEKAAVNDVPGLKEKVLAVENNNNQARWDLLGSIARTPADLDAAIAAREAAAEPSYQAARAQMYPVDASLESVMDRPAMRDALARGITISRNQGNRGFVQAVQGQAAQHTNVPTGGVSFSGQPLLQSILTRPATPGQPAQISGDVLHYIKLGLDDLQKTVPENSKLGPAERDAINDAQRDFLAWLDNASSDYKQGRQAYAANSPPVNTMQAGQQIAARLSGQNKALNTTGAPLMTAPGFATARDLALRAQEYGIDPAAEQSLTNIGNDLQRSTISNSLRSGSGSDTAYNIKAGGWLAKQLYGPGYEGATGLGRGLAAGVTALSGHPYVALGVYGGAKKLGQKIGERLQNQLGNYVLNPSDLLPYLDSRAAASTQAVPNQLVNRLLNYGRPALLGGALGQIVNPGTNP